MKELYAHILATQWLSKSVPYVKHAGSQKLAVIIDPRYDDLMLSVIKNFMFHLNHSGWNFLVVSHASHQDRVRADLPGVSFMPIDAAFLEDGHKPNMSIDSYNRILMDRDLWRALNAEHILIFQTDCYMFKMFDESKYLPYDYVGANWRKWRVFAAPAQCDVGLFAICFVGIDRASATKPNSEVWNTRSQIFCGKKKRGCVLHNCV